MLLLYEKEVRRIKINKKILLLVLIVTSITLNATTYKTTGKTLNTTTRTNNQITKNNTVNEIIIPKGLKPGDTIGLIAPANYTNENTNAEVEYLTSRGFNVVYGQSFYSRWYGFGGTDNIRAKDINDMFANPNIDAIFAVRGG